MTTQKHMTGIITHSHPILKRVRPEKLLLWLCGGVLVVSLVPGTWRYACAPRVWAAHTVPVAFWAWRTNAPSEDALQRAAREARARVLFLRAGQIDYEDRVLRRIRPLGGEFPRALEIHLVYNVTRSLLESFERVESEQLAALLVETYMHDAERAARDGAKVIGIQLDIDVPTRLLKRYEEVLRSVRAGLPPGTTVSITGLPTWMLSSELSEVLEATDFWIPQFYGAEIPDRVEKRVPISSPAIVARDVARARELGKPFYAGLAAYGYALLYSRDGVLMLMRGDIHPARIARDSNMELIERRAFDSRTMHATGTGGDATPIASEWRYVFRAREDGVTDGLAVKAGDHLVLDLPSSESLRAGARGVREHAGTKLLGICIFRLPEHDDPAILSLEQITTALSDTVAPLSIDVRMRGERRGESGAQAMSNHVMLEATNNGTAGALLGDGALSVMLRVPPGSVRGLSRLDGFTSFESLCESLGAGGEVVRQPPRPCGLRRANALRFTAPTSMLGETARAVISFDADPPTSSTASVYMRVDDGRSYTNEQTLAILKGDE